MASFGVSAAAVRQAVSRMSRQGWLAARRDGNRAFYSVTERGRRRIEELSPRIYGPVIEWDGRWRLLTYAIGEAHRKRRDRLRKELSASRAGRRSRRRPGFPRPTRSTPPAKPPRATQTLRGGQPLYAANTAAR